MKKTIFLLNIGNYEKKLTNITYPLIFAYAKKIGANVHVIKERKFPDFPVVYEKLQIYELGKKMGNDWNIYIDSDAIIHPDLFDITEHVSKDTVLHNGNDLAGNRWKIDDYFRRDGRWISSCNWFTIASDWCIDLWKPLDDMTAKEAIANIQPINIETFAGITPDHLIDDYTLSRNIAKYGLKFKTLIELFRDLGQPDFNYTWHQYTLSLEQKYYEMRFVLYKWGLQPAHQLFSKEELKDPEIIKVLESNKPEGR